MNNNCWLPQQEIFDNNKTTWKNYEDLLYSIFRKDFIDSHPYFENKIVNIRKHPMEFDKEEAFFHITCQDYSKSNNRQPDLRRCERIRWVRAFIENYNKCSTSFCDSCDGVKIWSEPYGNTERTHLLLEEERYIVVLEKRNNYVLLITAFYFEHDHALKKKLNHYLQYKNR